MKHLLKCKISPGQFSVEYAVQIESFRGEHYSLFTPTESVELVDPTSNDHPVDGWLRVEIADEKDDLVLLQLTQPTLGNGRFITVRKDQLKEESIPQEA